MKKILMVAGENSGDMHGATLVRALLERTPEIDFFGMGGAGMKDAGVRVLHDITHLAAVGLVESLSSLDVFLGTFRQIAYDVRREAPDLAILIDFPEFNLRLAPKLKELGVPVVYYISPQVWAWRPWRIKHIARYVDLMLVFFKFEEELYRKHGVKAEWVGHPLLDHLSDYCSREASRRRLGFSDNGTLIGLLPGSRRKEFERIFPILAESACLIAEKRRDVRFAVGCAPAITERELHRFSRQYRLVRGEDSTAVALQRGESSLPACGEGWGGAQVLCGGIPPQSPRKRGEDSTAVAQRHTREPEFVVLREKTYDLMCAADLLLVASGTATLEAAIIGTPMVVTYKCSPLSWFLTIPFINVSLYALVNVVAGRQVVPELLQWRARPELIAGEVAKLFNDGALKTMTEDLRFVKQQLGRPGAAGRAAEHVLNML